MRYQNIQAILTPAAAEDADLAGAMAAARTQVRRLDTFVAQEGDDAERFAASPDRDDYDLVLVAGGDGSLHEVVNGLLAGGRLDRVAVAILPFGTANDFALYCGFSAMPIEELLTATLVTEPTGVDIVSAGDRVFVNAASAGLGAEATSEASQDLKRILGKFAYFVSGLLKAGEVQGNTVQIRGEGFEWAGDIVGFVVANGAFAGGNVCAVPDAKIDDGLIDLLVIPLMPMVDLTRLAAQFVLHPANRNHIETPRCRSPWFEFHADEPIALNLDGEPSKVMGKRFEVLPNRLRLCIPVREGAIMETPRFR